jgi:hypothetical protein
MDKTKPCLDELQRYVHALEAARRHIGPLPLQPLRPDEPVPVFELTQEWVEKLYELDAEVESARKARDDCYRREFSAGE